MTRLLLIGFFLLRLVHLQAQQGDTLKVNLPQADSLLLTRNLSLIAAHYDIDKAEAARIQARLFNNPNVNTEWNLRNPEANKWFDAGRQGQKIIAIQEVFRIAGQRNAAMRIAQEQKRMAGYQYEELVRSVRYELHVSFYRYHFLNNAIIHIRSQLGLLKNLIEVYGEQYRKGNISLQELTRLNTTYFTISSQVKDAEQELAGLQQTLKILLAENRVVLPTDAQVVLSPLTGITLDNLLSRASANRPELKTIQSYQAQQSLQYSLAKKEAVPDLTAGLLYDQAGSYVKNYTAFTVGIQIPLFNRNQGQIQAAKIGIEQSKVLLQSKEKQIEGEVQTAWSVYHLLQEQYNAVGPQFETELDQLSEGLVKNYSKNNISLLEFTDLFESYNTNIIQYNQLKADLNKSYEDLTYAVGEELNR